MLPPPLFGHDFVQSEGPETSWLGYLSRNRVAIDSFRPRPRETSDVFRVLNHFSEPAMLMSDVDAVAEAAADYDLILTYSKELCRRLPNAAYFPFGSRWVPKGEVIRDEDCSIIFSEGGANVWKLPGYEHRVEVLRRLLLPDAPKINVFYSTRRPMRDTSRELLTDLFKHGLTLTPLTDQKLPAFESRYAIIIENTCDDSWFTEKIVDCFARKVTPIYIGCPNIGDFFDERGIIQCQNVDDIFDALAKIREGAELFNREAVETNYVICDYWEDVRGRLRNLVENEINTRRFKSPT